GERVLRRSAATRADDHRAARARGDTRHSLRAGHHEHAAWRQRTIVAGRCAAGPLNGIATVEGCQVLTVSNRYSAPTPNSRFGAQAANAGVITPPAPIAANTLIVV